MEGTGFMVAVVALVAMAFMAAKAAMVAVASIISSIAAFVVASQETGPPPFDYLNRGTVLRKCLFGLKFPYLYHEHSFIIPIPVWNGIIHGR